MKSKDILFIPYEEHVVDQVGEEPVLFVTIIRYLYCKYFDDIYINFFFISKIKFMSRPTADFAEERYKFPPWYEISPIKTVFCSSEYFDKSNQTKTTNIIKQGAKYGP